MQSMATQMVYRKKGARSPKSACRLLSSTEYASGLLYTLSRRAFSLRTAHDMKTASRQAPPVMSSMTPCPDTNRSASSCRTTKPATAPPRLPCGRSEMLLAQRGADLRNQCAWRCRRQVWSTRQCCWRSTQCPAEPRGRCPCIRGSRQSTGRLGRRRRRGSRSRPCCNVLARARGP